jgi:hypothetical protein
VHQLVRAATETGRTEIRLWGDAWPDDLDGRADDVSHRLSAAARAFKAQALAATAADVRPADTEDAQRALVLVIPGDHGDVPARQDLVAQPATRDLHHVSGTGRQGDQARSQGARDGGLLASWLASELVYS